MKLFSHKSKTGFTTICNMCGKDGAIVSVNAKGMGGLIELTTTITCKHCDYSVSRSESNY